MNEPIQTASPTPVEMDNTRSAEINGQLMHIVDRIAGQFPLNRERLQELTRDIQAWIQHHPHHLSALAAEFRQWVNPGHTPEMEHRSTVQTRSPHTIRNLQTAAPEGYFLRQRSTPPAPSGARLTTPYQASKPFIVETRPGMPVGHQQRVVLFKEWIAHLLKTGNGELLNLVFRLLPDMQISNMLPYLTANRQLTQSVEETMEKWQSSPENTVANRAYQAFLEALQAREREEFQELMRKRKAEPQPETPEIQRPQIATAKMAADSGSETNLTNADCQIPKDVILCYKAQGLVVNQDWKGAIEAYLEALRLNPDNVKAKRALNLIMDTVEKEIKDLSEKLTDIITCEEMKNPITCPQCHQPADLSTVIHHLKTAKKPTCMFCRANTSLKSYEQDNPFREMVKLKREKVELKRALQARYTLTVPKTTRGLA